MVRFDTPQERDENIYVANAESSAEAARLLDQDKFAKQVMGGLIPEKNDVELATITDILDVACGPGGWLHDMAYNYPYMQAVGIDLSKTMIDYARGLARVRGLRNVQFLVMDALQPLQFADASFDLVNARGAGGFVPAAYWPALLSEYYRILRPGGTVRIVEVESGFTNKPGFERSTALFNQALHRTGRSFSPSEHYLGMTPMLEALLRKAGFTQIQNKAYPGDFSAGSPLHESRRQNASFIFKLAQPMFIKLGLSTQHDLDILYDQTMAEMQSNDFYGMLLMFSAWGTKPVSTSHIAETSRIETTSRETHHGGSVRS